MDIRKWVVPIAGGLLGGLVLSGVHIALHPPWARPGAAALAPEPEPSLAKLSPKGEAKLDRTVQFVLGFVLLHETGHLLVSELDLPVLGREEDAADRFAAATMIKSGASQKYDALLPVAAFWDGMHQQQLHFDWSDEHSEPEQRAFDIFCLAYGDNQERYDQLADQIHFEQARKAKCSPETKKNINDWSRVLNSHFRSNGDASRLPSVAIVYDPVAPNLPGDVRAEQQNDRAYAKSTGALEYVSEWVMSLKLDKLAASSNGAPAGVHHLDPGADLTDFDYVLRGESCLDAKGAPVANAWWKPETHTMTLCYGLVAKIRQTEADLISRSESHHK